LSWTFAATGFSPYQNFHNLETVRDKACHSLLTILMNTCSIRSDSFWRRLKPTRLMEPDQIRESLRALKTTLTDLETQLSPFGTTKTGQLTTISAVSLEGCSAHHNLKLCQSISKFV
tara:strand:+ start:254 stop:604 length:351 start_codon:yes stop_codon:yes gene_type:complete